MEADHWAYLANILRAHGVVVDVRELRRLPHEVVFSQRLNALIAEDQGHRGSG